MKASKNLNSYIKTCQDISSKNPRASVLVQAMLALTKQDKINHTKKVDCFNYDKMYVCQSR